MKKILLLAASALLLCGLSACNQNPKGDQSEPIRIEVSVVAPQTRVTNVTSNDPSSEARVNSLQVFVFNGDALDGYGSSSTRNATVSCTSGSREVYAVVNAPSTLSSVTSKSALLASVSTLANEISNFQMIGSTTATLQASGNVPITVDRLAARVVIRAIKNSLENAAQAADFRVQAVYLTNVAGDVNYGKSSGYTVSRWYNQRGYQASNNLGSFTYDAVNAAIAAGATNSTAHFFYTMPNGNEGKVGGVWSPRACRLVIRASIAGTVYDYPILLPALESNKSYEISLVDITRVGNADDGNEPDDQHPDDDDEEKPVVGFEQGFQITVNDWSVVLVDGGNITI